jgi:ABC-type sugar transport system permease subunit
MASPAQPRRTFSQAIHHRTFRRRIFVWSVLTPILAWFVIYMFLPIASVVFYSFTNAKMQYSDLSFVGLQQYVKMFTQDPIIPIALWNTVRAVLIIVPCVLVLSLALAVGLNAMKRSREVFTFIYFLPSVVPMVAICLVWSWLYHPQYGLFNALLRMVGLPGQKFIQDSNQALQSISAVEIWYIFGYYAVILLAAIRGISPDLFEAADIDGANAWHKFRKIVIPMIKPNLVFVLIMSTIAAFMLFTPVDVLTLGRGTPGTSTMVLMLHIKIQGIQLGETGYTSAVSILLLAIILGISLVQWFLSRENKREGRKA